jgi:DNA polymerase-3 subunit delta'
MAKRQEKKFAWDVCGHERISAFLQSAIVNNKVSHAYLFVGPAGAGKDTLARQFIKSIFCLQSDQPSPCGDCGNCQQLDRGLHPDVYLVERLIDETTGKWKKDIVIEQLRELKQKLQQTTLLSGYKAALIPEAQLINEKAYNSLLKILEEPTAKTIIILLADDRARIPATIVSRCQLINFLPVASVTLEKYLAQTGAEPEKIKLLARLAHGLPGRAINFLKDGNSLDRLQLNLKSFSKIAKDSPGHRLNYLEELIDWEKDETQNAVKINRLLDDWQAALRDLLLLSQASQYYAASAEYLKDFYGLENKFGWLWIKRAAARLRLAKELLQQNINAKFVLENLIINL